MDFNSKIDLVDNYNEYYQKLNSTGKQTPLMHLTKQVQPEMPVKKDSFSISFAAQQKARMAQMKPDLQKLSRNINSKIKAHASNVKMD